MKTKILLAVGLLAAVTAFAALPTFKTTSAAGNASAPATAYLPSDPSSQIRVVYCSYASDTNKGALVFSTGTTAYWETQTNATSSSITNWVNSTNGMAGSSTLILEHAGVPYTSTVAALNAYSSTNGYGQTNWTYNVVLASGGWGVNTTVGDQIYLMTSPVSIPVGASTNVLSGDAVFVGNYGRPVQVQLTPALATNQIYSLSAHYDQASQN